MSEQKFEVNSFEDKGIAKFDSGIMFADGTQMVTASIQGIQGIQGIANQGVQGVQGTVGTQGAIGNTGSQGVQGFTGTQGNTGSTGTQGTTGNQGVQGLQGLQGTNGIQGVQGVQGPIGLAPTSVIINPQSTSYTLALSDAGKLVNISSSSANTITVPTNSSVSFPIGTQINITSSGTGQTTVVAASGVTVNSTPGLKLRTQYSLASIIKMDTDLWVLGGDLS